MSFEKIEQQLEKLGRVKKISDTMQDKMFFVWYEIDGKKRIIPSTMSFAEEGAISKIKNVEKLIQDKTLPDCKYGVACLDAIFSNFDFEQKKEDTHIGCNLIKEAELYVVSAKRYAKPKIAADVDLWNKFSVNEFVVLDTETTGIGYKDEVVELAAVRVRDFVIVDQFQTYIIPTVSISKEAQAVHGLSLSFLKENGRNAKDVFSEFRDWLGDTHITGHNVMFDKGKIEGHGNKVGVKFNLNVLFDTLQISRRFMVMENHKLDNIVDRLDLRKGLKSHSALDDVIATLRYCSVLRQLYADQHHTASPIF